MWSFSHLTFQEYFTVQWLLQLPSEQLAEKIANQQWQRAIEQVVNSQQPADRLLQLIKQSIDRSTSGEPALNQFLTWVLQKSEPIQANYKPAVLRAFYFDLELVRPLELARDLDRNFNRDFNLVLNQELDLARDFNRILVRAQNINRDFDDLDFDRDLNLAQYIDRDLALKRALALDRDLIFNPDLVLDLTLTLALELVLNRKLTQDIAFAPDRILTRALDRTPVCQCNSDLAVKLEQLRTVLPSPKNWQQYQQWWQSERQQWLEQLRQVMIKYRNIGHNWQFSSQQRQQLQRYYNTNRFLVKLMRIEGAVKDVYAEIEDNLLLPWEELQLSRSQ